MTAQISDTLIFKNETIGIYSEPLKQYLEEMQLTKLFTAPSSACWRGYVANWMVSGNKLYLISIKGHVLREGEEELTNFHLNDLFPNEQEVLADWFSGEIVIPRGDMVKYIHYPYASTYESYTILLFDRGTLIREFEKSDLIGASKKHSSFIRLIRRFL